MEDIPSELLGIFGDISTPPDYYKQPMETWDAYQVTDFLRRETWCPDCNFNIDSFHSVSGYIFRHLSPTQCEAFLRSKEHGKHIYDIKENFLNNWNRDGKLSNLNKNFKIIVYIKIIHVCSSF